MGAGSRGRTPSLPHPGKPTAPGGIEILLLLRRNVEPKLSRGAQVTGMSPSPGIIHPPSNSTRPQGQPSPSLLQKSTGNRSGGAGTRPEPRSSTRSDPKPPRNRAGCGGRDGAGSGLGLGDKGQGEVTQRATPRSHQRPCRGGKTGRERGWRPGVSGGGKEGPKTPPGWGEMSEQRPGEAEQG